MKNLVIIGAGGFAKELIWVVEEVNKIQHTFEILGLLDEDKEKDGLKVLDFQVFGELKSSSFWSEKPVHFICSVSEPAYRKRLVRKANDAGYCFTNVIHPAAVISDYARLGQGIVILPGTIVTVDVKLGNHVIINKLCSIGHETIIKNYCTLAPGVKVGGNVLIEEECNIGMNASIIQSVKIGKGTNVGAGAVVIDDLPAGCTAVGVPAKVIR